MERAVPAPPQHLIMAKYDHLPIYKQTYDLLFKVTDLTKHYPRDFKSFAGSIREEISEVIFLIYKANSNKQQRVEFIQRILDKMETVQLSLRLSCDMKFITVKQFSLIAALLVNIVKQAHGWLDYSRKVQEKAEC